MPADWDAKPVKVVVKQNFKQVVMDTEKTAFIFICKLLWNTSRKAKKRQKIIMMMMMMILIIMIK